MYLMEKVVKELLNEILKSEEVEEFEREIKGIQ